MPAFRLFNVWIFWLSRKQNKAFAKIIRTVKEDIEGGTSLTDALKKYPKIFDELFVNLIAAGEAGGILDVVLERLSNYMEKAMKLKSTVKGAMTYPIAVLVISFACRCFIAPQGYSCISKNV